MDEKRGLRNVLPPADGKSFIESNQNAFESWGNH